MKNNPSLLGVVVFKVVESTKSMHHILTCKIPIGGLAMRRYPFRVKELSF